MNGSDYMRKVDDKHRVDAADTKSKFANLELADFLDRVERFELNDLDAARLPVDGKHVRSFASYVSDYYLWMFCCHRKFCSIRKHFERTGRVEQCLESALRRLMAFDVVLIAEWLDDARTQSYLNRKLLGHVQRLFVAVTARPSVCCSDCRAKREADRLAQQPEVERRCSVWWADRDSCSDAFL